MKSLINEQKFHYKDKSIINAVEVFAATSNCLFTPDIRQQMEELISNSLSKSQNVHKAIKVFQQGLAEPASSRIISRVKNLQLSLIKNEYLNVYREHSVFVEKYEEKLKKILKREAQISEVFEFEDAWMFCNKFYAILVSRSMSIEETEQLLINKEFTPSLFVGNVRKLR